MDSVSSLSIAAPQQFYDDLQGFVKKPETLTLKSIRFIGVLDQASIDSTLALYSDEKLQLACSFLERELESGHYHTVTKESMELLPKHISASLENRQIPDVTLEIEERTEPFREIAEGHGLDLKWKLLGTLALMTFITGFCVVLAKR